MIGRKKILTEFLLKYFFIKNDCELKISVIRENHNKKNKIAFIRLLIIKDYITSTDLRILKDNNINVLLINTKDNKIVLSCDICDLDYKTRRELNLV